MRRPLVAVVIAAWAAVAAVPCSAADPKDPKAGTADPKAGAPAASDILSWFQRLEAGLRSSLLGNARQDREDAAAVAAVRAAPQSASNAEAPAWVGGILYERMDALKKEKKELANAVDLIVKGRFAEGSKALIAFETAHPKSSLLKDALEAQRKLKALEKPAPKKDASSAATSVSDAP